MAVTALPFQLVVSRQDLVHRLKTVMRYQPGDALVLVDATHQQAYHGVIEALHKKTVTVNLISRLAEAPIKSPQIIAAVSLIKGPRWEWVLQKLTELGVSQIIPLQPQHSVVAVKQLDAKHSRWQEIIMQAAEQSEQVRLPMLHTPIVLPEFAADVASQQKALKLVASERGGAPLTHELLQQVAWEKIVFAIGPEGGWAAAELDLLRSAGFQSVHFGDTILRSETAAMYLASILHYACRQNPSPSTTD